MNVICDDSSRYKKMIHPYSPSYCTIHRPPYQERLWATIAVSEECFTLHASRFTLHDEYGQECTVINFPILSWRIVEGALTSRFLFTLLHGDKVYTWWHAFVAPPYRDENLYDDRNGWTSQFTITITSFRSLIKTRLTSKQIVNTNHHGECDIDSRRWGVRKSRMEKIQRNFGHT